MKQQKGIVPIEKIDAFLWKERSKIITRDVHGISGLMNFTHFNHIASEPSTPIHYHNDIMEIHCIVKGRRVNRLFIDGEIQDHVYTGGEAFVIFPGECHSTGNTDRQEPCEVVSVQLNLSEADSFLGLNRSRGRELCRRLAAINARHLRLNPETLDMLRCAFDLFSSMESRKQDAGLVHILCFLYRFLELPPAATQLHAPSDARMQQIVHYIDENITEPLSLTVLAEHTGYSLSRFKTKFRGETGLTPAAYITSRKIEYAKEVLETTSQSITDVAYNLGWSSGNYFCSVFKKLTGMSPLQYRRRNRYDDSK